MLPVAISRPCLAVHDSLASTPLSTWLSVREVGWESQQSGIEFNGRIVGEFNSRPWESMGEFGILQIGSFSTDTPSASANFLRVDR